jgi:hypothetical protein
MEGKGEACRAGASAARLQGGSLKSRARGAKAGCSTSGGQGAPQKQCTRSSTPVRSDRRSEGRRGVGTGSASATGGGCCGSNGGGTAGCSGLPRGRRRCRQHRGCCGHGAHNSRGRRRRPTRCGCGGAGTSHGRYCLRLQQVGVRGREARRRWERVRMETQTTPRRDSTLQVSS